jgi:hypothetical protein
LSIIYDPKKMLGKIAPEKKVKKLITKKVSLKKAALSFVDAIDFLDRKRVTEVALKTVRGYKERIAKAVVDAGFDRSAGKEERSEILDDPKQLINRVQNEVVLQISEAIKDKYAGRTYTWLPSDAEEPDPEHQLNYGKRFVIGEGEMPGERYGCRCGMEIDGDEKQLSL